MSLITPPAITTASDEQDDNFTTPMHRRRPSTRKWLLPPTEGLPASLTRMYTTTRATTKWPDSDTTPSDLTSLPYQIPTTMPTTEYTSEETTGELSTTYRYQPDKFKDNRDMWYMVGGILSVLGFLLTLLLFALKCIAAGRVKMLCKKCFCIKCRCPQLAKTSPPTSTVEVEPILDGYDEPGDGPIYRGELGVGTHLKT